MRQVTLIGPHTGNDGRQYVKGDVIDMSDEDAQWYADAVSAGRNPLPDNPMIAEPARPPIPADPTAHPDVATDVASIDRSDWSVEGIARTFKVGDEPQTETRSPSPSERATNYTNDEASRAGAREFSSNAAPSTTGGE